MRSAALPATVLWLLAASAPLSARAEAGAPPPADPHSAARAGAEDGGEPRPSPRGDLGPGPARVAHLEAVPGLSPGDRLGAGRYELAVGACIRLVGPGFSLALAGPGVLALGERDGQLAATVEGRGVLAAGAEGASLTAGGETLAALGGAVAFETPSRSAWTLAGAARVSGEPAAEDLSGVPPELGGVGFCAPAARALRTIRLGEPEALAASAAERRQAREAGAEEEGQTAEGGATCVDSAAEGSAASDPTGPGEGGVDPDARRGAGTVRVRIEVPGRAP